MSRPIPTPLSNIENNTEGFEYYAQLYQGATPTEGLEYHAQLGQGITPSSTQSSAPISRTSMSTEGRVTQDLLVLELLQQQANSIQALLDQQRQGR